MGEEEMRRKQLEDGNLTDSEEGSSITILLKTTETFKEIFEKTWVKYHHSLKKFDTHNILDHIGARKSCKSFYGSKFDDFKKEKNKLRNNAYRRENFHSNLEKKEEKR